MVVVWFGLANHGVDNVNEVFIDLCRQMLRKDDLSDFGNDDLEGKLDPYGWYSWRKKRREKREKEGTRCVIL